MPTLFDNFEGCNITFRFIKFLPHYYRIWVKRDGLRILKIMFIKYKSKCLRLENKIFYIKKKNFLILASARNRRQIGVPEDWCQVES